MEFAGKVAVITGAASGIGQAVAAALAHRDVSAMALVDMGDAIDGVAADVNKEAGREVAFAYKGNTTDEAFRASVFDSEPSPALALLPETTSPAFVSCSTNERNEPGRGA